ncbi:hypothetical protein BU24DRAFT_147657 [Aaosphaeria arxii CBS 175.79]|uniref:Uncharacterized protein n=1 Tax=Aaosphaeria arxii CBS 175.79 TaxID=1450172 RepID=A0A6A5XYD6_9PLEO|nr:uncharacterized protein BU24DRAFT_147657 [Aaosphaeria arxii CBS 175.79]KAF2017294.1 hypothetical protein BU24DRAFT_147657 [Aaosphaeria arxii CBS 175.79]
MLRLLLAWGLLESSKYGFIALSQIELQAYNTTVYRPRRRSQLHQPRFQHISQSQYILFPTSDTRRPDISGSLPTSLPVRHPIIAQSANFSWCLV